ncbi:MAG: hypothetical protein KC478_13955 [Bacteriovoracaceae bacterium]|nr:hypothetical protein [Bacteriovoracaceae bacterium]
MENKNLKVALLALRLGVFIVMFMWTLDKFINPAHSMAVWGKFYFLGGMSETIMYIAGGAQMIVVLMFLAGFAKRFSYAVILLLHSVSTFSAFAKYLEPWSNLLFFAAWPMLAACLALFLLRDEDTLFNVSK